MANVALVATLTVPLCPDKKCPDRTCSDKTSSDIPSSDNPSSGSAPFALAEIAELPDSVTWLQWRADLAGHVSASSLRDHFSGELLYSLRSYHHGGAYAGPATERHGHLLAATPHYDLLELEAETDLTPELLSAIPPRKRLISWSGPACDAAQLRRTFDQMSSVPARSYYLTMTAEKTSHGLQTLLFLKALGRNDVTAFCQGPFGLWSRLLAPSFGAPFLFGHTGLATSSSGEPAISKLISDYGFPAVHPVHELYGMVGNRIFQSPSPRLHNAGYRALNYPALFVPFHEERFEDFWKEMIAGPELESLGIPLQGLTIVSPHK